MTEQTTTADKPLFTAVEIEQFEADDVVAGSAIGKMLSILFLYTVLAMSLVTYVTFSWVNDNHGQPSTEVQSEQSGH